MTCVQHMHCALRFTETDAATKEVNYWCHHRGQAHACRHDWSSSNYQAKANFRIEIMKVLDHGNAWAPAETFGQDRINQKIRLARVILTEVYCTGSLHSGNGSRCERSQMKYT